MSTAKEPHGPAGGVSRPDEQAVPSALPRAFGASVKRKEDRRLITGRGNYTDDLLLPDQAFAAFVRSPHAHAAINSIDAEAAREMPGVVAVLTGEEFAASGLGPLMCGWMIHSRDGEPMKVGEHPALASDKVRYVGDAVALVVADSLQAARDAAECVYVDYDDLPAVADVVSAGSVDAPELHSGIAGNEAFDWEIGDADAVAAAFARAAHVTRLRSFVIIHQLERPGEGIELLESVARRLADPTLALELQQSAN